MARRSSWVARKLSLLLSFFGKAESRCLWQVWTFFFMVLSFAFLFCVVVTLELEAISTSLTSSQLTRLTGPVGAEQIAPTIGRSQGFRSPTEPPTPANARHFILGQCA